MDPDLAKLRLWFRNHFLPAMEAPGEARGEARGEAKGKAKGKQQALLVLLSARELPVSSSQRKQIDACTDLDVLDAWIRCAASAISVARVLAPPPRESPWFREFRLEQEAKGEARGEARGEAKGKAKGKQQALLVLLSTCCDLPVSSSQRKQIDACTDHDVLDTWIRRAASASSVAKVLAPVARSPRKATAKPARPRAKPARPKAKPARPRAKPARPTAPGRATRAEGTDRSSAAPAQTPSRRRRSIQRET